MSNSTLYGPMDLPDWPDDLIVQALQLYGEWGAVETAIFGHLLPENAVLWDCGAFLGSFTLGVAKHCKLYAALAIEANPELAPFLESNLGRLAPCPVTVVLGGVGARQGSLRLQNQGGVTANHGAQAYDFGETDPDGADTVPCYPLKNLRRRYGDYTALKLDVEGMEVDVIKGDYAYIKERHPIIWAECNEEKSSLTILSALKSLGYKPVYVAFPAFRKKNYLSNPDLQYSFAYEASLFAAPHDLLDTIDWSHEVFEDAIVREVATIFDLRKAMFDTPRWGRPDWEALSRAELIARLTRAISDQNFETFLTKCDLSS